MTAHDHSEFIPGCFRCDLNSDEADAPTAVMHVNLYQVSKEIQDEIEQKLDDLTDLGSDIHVYSHSDDCDVSDHCHGPGSRWLTAHDAALTAQIREEIAGRIEAERDDRYNDWRDVGLNVAATIARTEETT